MLNIYYGDMDDAVYNTASYFKYDYEDAWMTDDFVKEMIRDVTYFETDGNDRTGHKVNI